MKNLLPNLCNRLLLVLVLMMATLSDAVAGEFVFEEKASIYEERYKIPKLLFFVSGEDSHIGEMTFELGDFRTSEALIPKNRNFKLMKDTYMRLHAKDGYVIKEIYAYSQTKGETFELRSDLSKFAEQCRNYYAGQGDGFGIFLYEDGSAMQDIYLRAKSDMEFAVLKVTLQKENPVNFISQVVEVNCLRTVNLKFSDLPADYTETITYSTSDASVATVSNGVIRGVKVGTATISALFRAYGDYGPKRISITADVQKGSFSPKFENQEENRLSSEQNILNPLLNVPSDYDGKVEFTIDNYGDNHFSIADPKTGQLALPPMESGWAYGKVTVTFTGSNSFENASCSYLARAYAADDEGYIKISNYSDFAYYRDLDFVQDKKMRLYSDIDITDQDKQWEKMFKGELDGAGHTLNFKNVQVSNAFFSTAENAKFHDLKFTGQITINASLNGGVGAALIRRTFGKTELSRCQSDVILCLDNAGITMCGALVGLVSAGGLLDISDCRVGTKIEPTTNASSSCQYAAFVGLLDGELHLNNSLFCGDISNIPNMKVVNGSYGTITGENYYMLYANDAVDNQRLMSGDVAYKLQGGREETVWGQTLAPLDGTEVDVDSAPVLTTDAAKRVHRLTPAVAPDEALVYSNALEPMLPLSVSSAGYATYYNSFAVSLPSAVKAYTISGISDGQLTLSEIAGSVVPAMTAVLLKSPDDAGFTGRMQMQPTDNQQPIAGADNLLRGSDEATKTHAANGVCDESGTTDDGSTLYYKFAYGRSGTASASQLGFWWGAAQGAPFQSAAHKAWLAVPSQRVPSRVQGFAIIEGSTPTGIESPTTQTAQAPIYTLDGVRLNGQPVRRGVYIVNGKKVMMGK